jgi:PAS domain S-box-containing protein
MTNDGVEPGTATPAAERAARIPAHLNGHALLELAARLARVGGWSADLSTRSVFWSDEVRSIHEAPAGFRPTLEQAIEFFAPAWRGSIQRAVDACTGDGVAYDLELEIISVRGRRIWVRAIGQPVHDDSGRIVGIQGAYQDIDAQKRTETSVAELADRFKAVARATADVVWDWNLQQEVRWWNAGMQTLFGYHETEIGNEIGAWSGRVHPQDRDRVLAKIDDALQSRSDVWRAEYRFQRKDGTYAHVLDQGFIIRDSSGTPVRMVGAIRDQTERHDYQVRLAEQAALLDQARDAIIVRDLDHRIRFWNQGATRLYGWSRDEALGASIEALLYGDTAEFRRATQTTLGVGEWSGELRQRRRDGTEITVAGNWTLMRDEAGAPKAVLAINTDISKRLEVEAQLRQAQRLEAVGQLTGGIAHDFNNLLTVILGNAELLIEFLSDDEQLRGYAEMSRTAAERGADLTGRLLAFARRQALKPEVIDVNQMIGRMDELLRRTIGGNIEIEMVRGAGLWGTLVDPAQLEAALLNLCINARDAMPRGGRLTIETTNAWLDESYAASYPEVQPGPYVLLAVTDTGTGIPADMIERIFEPFFTTKEVGKGSGLGLSMVYGFVKQSGGHVRLYSEVECGTTVKVYLRRSDLLLVNGADEPLVPETAGGSESILMVEDDGLVRDHVSAQLEMLGYRVTSVPDARSALDALGRDPYDLLFTDVVMPGGVNGRELAEIAWTRHPGLRVLFTSGYTEHAIVHHGRLDSGAQLLSKPYSRLELAHKLRQALGAPPGDAPDPD